MKGKNITVISAMMLFLMVSVFAVIYFKSGTLPAKVVGLVAATCLPPVGMLIYTSRNGRR